MTWLKVFKIKHMSEMWQFTNFMSPFSNKNISYCIYNYDILRIPGKRLGEDIKYRCIYLFHALKYVRNVINI